MEILWELLENLDLGFVRLLMCKCVSVRLLRIVFGFIIRRALGELQKRDPRFPTPVSASAIAYCTWDQPSSSGTP